MSDYPIVRLRADREESLTGRHPWIFSGAIDRSQSLPEHGSTVTVRSGRDEFVGIGTWSNASMIAVRLFTRQPGELSVEFFKTRFEHLNGLRQLLGYGDPDRNEITGYRVVFGEADGLPGLIVDRYEDVLVFQISTAGLDRLRETIVEALAATLSPSAIYEKSDMGSRAEEKLESSVGVRFGELPDQVTFREFGLSCIADVVDGQKTGFFLDQRDLRRAIAGIAGGCTNGLDLFAYSGATTIAALRAGCDRMTCVDSSERALKLCHQHAARNDIAADRLELVSADVFQWLGAREEPSYDLVLLDPPALVKAKKHVESGRKGYHFLNRAALRLIKDGGLLATSSCSAFFTEQDLTTTLRRASEQVGVTLEVVGVYSQAADHPRSIYFPESHYLKSYLCRVNRS